MVTRNGEPMERGGGETLSEIAERKIARRTLLKGMLAFPAAAAQSTQFGYNCDYVAFFPLGTGSKEASTRGILAVNHEYTNPELMFIDYNEKSSTATQVDVQLAAHGLALVEIELVSDKWKPLRNSRYNRRITAETLMELSGRAAGNELLKTSYDSAGRKVRGTLNNCGGGITPWGTLLTAEENFNQYFANRNNLADSDPRKAIQVRYGLPIGNSERRWENFHSRFDLAKDPNEPFRFGWVVEIDPLNPKFVPKKRTALGRMKHEAATVVVAPDRRVAVYTGDDERFDFIYKFVSKRQMSKRREDNFSLLDEGTLYVAKLELDADGKGAGRWIPWSPDSLVLRVRWPIQKLDKQSCRQDHCDDEQIFFGHGYTSVWH
jgi:secreted PhoX family phosphatase